MPMSPARKPGSVGQLCVRAPTHSRDGPGSPPLNTHSRCGLVRRAAVFFDAPSRRCGRGPALALFSLHGFDPDVIGTAGRRRDVLLVDIGALYGDGAIRGLT